MKKILLVHSSLSSLEFSYAGIEKMLTWVGNELAKNGSDITFCTLYDRERSEALNTAVKSIELAIPYEKSSIKRLFRLFIINAKDIACVLRNKYDYVISFGDTSCVLLLFLRFIYKYKLIISERGDPSSNGSFMVNLRRRLYRFFDMIVFQTEGAANLFNQCTRRKSVIIPNPISIPDIGWTIEAAKHKISNVGRIDFYQKRQDLLVIAFKEVLKMHPDFELHFYGSGADEEKLQKLVDDLYLQNSVFLHGAVKNVQSQIIDSSLFVLASDFEGIPNALLEAMALGLPVISTDCKPGGARMLIDGTNGTIVPCGDPKALADAICETIESPERQIIFGKNARKCMEQYHPDIIMRKWTNLIY